MVSQFEQTKQALLATNLQADSQERLWTLIRNHHLVYDVTTAGHDHKAKFNITGFRVLTYDRLKLLKVLLQAVIYFEAAIAQTALVGTHYMSDRPHAGDHPRNFLAPPMAARIKGELKNFVDVPRYDHEDLAGST